MASYSNYLGSKKCCLALLAKNNNSGGSQGPQGYQGSQGALGFVGSQGVTGSTGPTGPSQWTTMNGTGPQGTVYTGIGVTGQDVIIEGNLYVSGIIDPTQLIVSNQYNHNKIILDSLNSNSITLNDDTSSSSISLVSTDLTINSSNQVIMKSSDSNIQITASNNGILTSGEVFINKSDSHLGDGILNVGTINYSTLNPPISISTPHLSSVLNVGSIANDNQTITLKNVVGNNIILGGDSIILKDNSITPLFINTLSYNGMSSNDDLTISSTENQVTINSADNININAGVNFVVTATDGINLNGINNNITLNATNSNIVNNAGGFQVNASDFITLTAVNDPIDILADDAINIKTTNGNINLTAIDADPSGLGKVYINKTVPVNAGDGDLLVGTINLIDATSGTTYTNELTAFNNTIQDGTGGNVGIYSSQSVSLNDTVNSRTISLASGIGTFTDDVSLTAITIDARDMITSGNPQITITNSVDTTTINQNSITTTAFNGALVGNATTATIATTATNVAINDDNTNATFYPTFVSDNTGNRPLKVDKTTNPLSYIPSTGNLTSTLFTGMLSTGGLVFLSTGSVPITGSASTNNFNLTSVFNSTYKNYRIVLAPTTQLTFLAHPSYSLYEFLGSGVPTIASLYGFEITSSALISPVYTPGATINSTPLILAVSQTINHQTIIEIENVGYITTSSQQIGLKCKSFYGNLSVNGASDRSILATAEIGATITGLTLQQSSISTGNTMTIGYTIYGYK